jgi:phosphatidylinositol glycan class B
MILFSITVDSLYYGKLTWCIWNFTHFNLLSGAASFFGEEGYLWLFVGIIPYLFLGWVLFIPFGM